MDPARQKPPSSGTQHEVFFTQENYKKHSCRPSFVEFLEKHLSPDKDAQKRLPQHDSTMGSLEATGHNMNKETNKTGAEKSRSNSAPACLGPAMEFPFISKISIESQKVFLKVFETLRAGQLDSVDLQEVKAVQDIKNVVMMEQEQYQQFVHTHVKTNHHLYNFIHPDIWNYFKMEVEGQFNESINKYPFYSLQETIGLAAGAVFKSDAVLTFERTLLQVGNVPKLCLPENNNIMLSEVSVLSDENTTVMRSTSAAVKTNPPKVVSEDPIAVSLAKKHKVDIVISSSGLNTLLDNQPSDYRKQWQLPITVQRQQVQSPPQELYNEALAASVLNVQAQSKNVSTYEREIPVDGTKAETVHKSSISAVNITVKAIPLLSSNETVRNFITGATSVLDKTVLTRDSLENTTATFRKQDFSNDETVQEFNCKQLKNRTSVYGNLNLHEWHGWCGYAVDDLRREPLFPFKPHVNDVLSKFETNVTKRTFNGRRIFGYVHPTITGDFVFAISSADGSELWLSTDDDPKHSKKIAYLGDPGNQYGATTKFAQFTSRKGQISENIRLEAGKAYYVEVLQKQKYNQDHVEVAWKMPGKEKLEIIESQFLSQYIDYSADKVEINGRILCICKDHPTLPFAYDEFMTREKYDMRDDFHVRVETLPHFEVSDVLPSCPCNPSYLVSRKLNENEALSGNFIQHPRVYPDDRTDVNMSHDIKNHISWGNNKLPKNEALKTVSAYMDALVKSKGDRFSLKEIVNVEAKVDPKKGTRFLLELELVDKHKGRSVRLSEYVYSSKENNSILCYPEGFQWRRNVTVSMVITVKNYGPWIKFLISQLDQIYQQGADRNFFLVIVDFNSSDIDLFKLRERSGIKDRIAILQKFTEFHKTKALNDGVGYIKDPNSLILTADLHIKFPANVFDVVRKHAIQGRSFYSPAVLKLKCGYSISHQQAYWEMMGYGLFGGYKSDWDSFGGLDEEKFTTRWGGEDWDLMDRALSANLEVERLRLPKLYHYYHERKSDWYENARL